MCDSIEAKKKYLRRYLEAQRDINRIMEEIESAKVSFLRAQSLDGMPHGSGENTADLSNVMVKLSELGGELDVELSRLYGIRREIRKRLNHMTNEAERNVLFYRYIIGHRWEDIAERMQYDLRRVYQIHGSALQHF